MNSKLVYSFPFLFLLNLFANFHCLMRLLSYFFRRRLTDMLQDDNGDAISFHPGGKYVVFSSYPTLIFSRHFPPLKSWIFRRDFHDFDWSRGVEVDAF